MKVDSTFIPTFQERNSRILQESLPGPNKNPYKLHHAMHYAVLNGGKRLRPLCVYAVGLALGAPPEALDLPAAAIELIHCYSLTHDDLPSMDDDDFRRDRLSCHKAFDEPTAILVGDALQSLAFELLSQPSHCLPALQQTQMIHTLAHAAGSLGMAGGQQLDMDSKGSTLTESERANIHSLKTAVLFQAVVKMGLIAAKCEDDAMYQTLDQWAKTMGAVFQLNDDYLDDDAHDEHSKDVFDLFKQSELLLSGIKTSKCAPLFSLQRYFHHYFFQNAAKLTQ